MLDPAKFQFFGNSLKIYEWYDDLISAYRSEPEPFGSYAMGIDWAGGYGGDFLVMVVLKKTTWGYYVVATMRDNHISDYRFAKDCLAVARIFNTAWIVPESNPPTLSRHIIEELGYTNVYMSEPVTHLNAQTNHTVPGFVTTKNAKTSLIKFFVGEYVEDRVHIPDVEILSEMSHYHYANGKMEAAVGHDDYVMATALAVWGTRNIEAGRVEMPALPDPSKEFGLYSAEHMKRVNREKRRMDRNPNYTSAYYLPA